MGGGKRWDWTTLGVKRRRKFCSSYLHGMLPFKGWNKTVVCVHSGRRVPPSPTVLSIRRSSSQLGRWIPLPVHCPSSAFGSAFSSASFSLRSVPLLPPHTHTHHTHMFCMGSFPTPPHALHHAFPHNMFSLVVVVLHVVRFLAFPSNFQ